MILGIDPTVDYVFKRLFAVPANRDILIHLLNAVLALPQKVVEVVILSPFNEKEFAQDKLSVLDVKARGDNGVWYNIEIQGQAHWSLSARLAYYGAKLFVDQLKEGEDYDGLSSAVTICFLGDVFFRNSPEAHLQFSLCDARHQVQLTDRLQVHTIELPKYNFEGVNLVQADALAQWAFFLRQAPSFEGSELRRILPQAVFSKAIGVLEMIAQTPQERLQYEARRKAELDYRSNLNDARRVGLEEGLKLGLVGQVQLLQGLLKEAALPVEQLQQLDNETLSQLIERLKSRLHVS